MSGTIRKYGRVAVLQLTGENITITSEGWNTLATIPSGYRSAANQYYLTGTQWSNNIDCQMDSDGNIYAYVSVGTGQRIQLKNFVYITE